jgi:predicted ATP-dependent serine protease
VNVPGWECSKCSHGNPLTRARCRKCGKKKAGLEKVVQVKKGNGKRTRLQVLKSKSKKKPTRKGVK